MIVKLQLVFLVVLYSLSQYACNGTENSNLKMEGLLNRDAKLLISGGFSGEEIKIRVDAKDVGSIKSAETDSVLGVASTFDIESYASEGSKVKIIVI